MGRVCSTHEIDEKCVVKFIRQTERTDHFEDLCAGERIIIKYILKK
jgi:hypothetical protein